jgi:hypothetical protein
MIDPDKKVEEIKKEREGIYQSTQHPEHFDNEGDEYLDLREKEDNDISEKADFDKVYGLKPESKTEDKNKGADKTKSKDPSEPEVSADSGIPGTSETKDIGTSAGGAGLGDNKGTGTSRSENQKNT